MWSVRQFRRFPTVRRSYHGSMSWCNLWFVSACADQHRDGTFVLFKKVISAAQDDLTELSKITRFLLWSHWYFIHQFITWISQHFSRRLQAHYLFLGRGYQIWWYDHFLPHKMDSTDEQETDEGVQAMCASAVDNICTYFVTQSEKQTPKETPIMQQNTDAPQVLPYLMVSLLNTVLFEDSSVQWSLSRPLLGLIVLQRDVPFYPSIKIWWQRTDKDDYSSMSGIQKRSYQHNFLKNSRHCEKQWLYWCSI